MSRFQGRMVALFMISFAVVGTGCSKEAKKSDSGAKKTTEGVTAEKKPQSGEKATGKEAAKGKKSSRADSTPKYGAVSWGKTVNNLAIGLAIPAAGYKADKPFYVKLHLKNTGKKALNIFWAEGHWGPWRVNVMPKVGGSSQIAFIGGGTVKISGVNNTLLVPAKSQKSARVKLVLFGPTDGVMNFRLSAGTYVMMAKYNHPTKTGTLDWAGQASSASLKVVVRP